MRVLGILVVLAAAIWLAGLSGDACGNDWATTRPSSARPLGGWLGITARAVPSSSPFPTVGSQRSKDRSDSEHAAWYGECMGVPTYNWGYFGVKSRAYTVTHGAYYDDHQESGTRRGY